MNIYLDIVFFENAFIDFILIYSTAIILNRKINVMRIFVSSVIGGLGATLCVINCMVKNIVMYNDIFKFAIMAIIIKFTFKSKSFKQFIKDFIVFFLNSSFISGCCYTYIFIHKSKSVIIINGIMVGGEFSLWKLFFSIIGASVVCVLGFSFVKKKLKINKANLCINILMENNGKRVNIESFVDSGNFLTDIVTGKPIVVVEMDKIKKIITKDEYDLINKLIGGDEFFIGSQSNRIRAIPYMSVGNKNGVMYTYKIDYLETKFQDEVYIVKNPLIGLYNSTFTKNGSYSGLIGLHFFERSKFENEFSSNSKIKSKCGIC